MVVKNGDESHGTVRKKSTTQQISIHYLILGEKIQVSVVKLLMKKRSTIKPKFWSFLFAEEKQGTRYPPGNVREEPYPTIHGKFGKSSTQVGAGSKKGDMDQIFAASIWSPQ